MQPTLRFQNRLSDYPIPSRIKAASSARSLQPATRGSPACRVDPLETPRDAECDRLHGRVSIALRQYPIVGQAIVHILVAAMLGGLVVRGPMVGQDQAFVSTEGWLGSPAAGNRTSTGIGTACESVPGRPRASVCQRPGALGRHHASRGPTGPRVRRRGPFPAWQSTTSASSPRAVRPAAPWMEDTGVRTRHHRTVVTTNGIFRPVALVRGRVVGTWSLRDGNVKIVPSSPSGTRLSDC